MDRFDKVRLRYKFIYKDEYGLKHKITDVQLLDEENELSQMLDEFKRFLHICGYLCVDSIQVTTKQGNTVSNIY